MNEQNPSQTENVSQSRSQRDDALFDALSKSKKQKKRRVLRTVLTLVALVLVVLVVGVSIARRTVRERFALDGLDVLSRQAETGTISTLVSGTGVLSNVDTEMVTVPDGVELTEILAENGDSVQSGQLLAIADMATVHSAMSDLQETIDDLDDQIHDASGVKASAYVNAGVPGRVKIVYGQVGDSVADVMVEHGALAVLSLDGCMAVELKTPLLSVGDEVTVIRASGAELSGTVDSVVAGTATILVTDDGTEPDETVTIRTAGGAEIGSGELYIHNPLMVTGYAGTIQGVHAVENAKVYRNYRMFSLRDTEFSASYDTLLRDRKEAEETLLELLNIQMHGGITAPVAGTVFNVADLEVTEIVTDLLELSPDVSMSVTIGVDESDILSLALEQKADVVVSSISDDVLPGIVTEINKTASDGAYTAVITLDKGSGMLPGMTAEVDIRIQGSENALLVPAEAVHYISSGAFVYTSYNPETEEYGGRVDVVTGLSNDDYVEILSGLKPGDTVYYTETTDFFSMFPGMGNQGGNRNNRGSSQPSGNPGGGQAPREGAPGGPG